MANNKRPSLSSTREWERTPERRGVDALIPTDEPVETEQTNIKYPSAVKQQTEQPKQEKPQRKLGLALREDQHEALADIQYLLKKTEGRKVDKTDLAQEAFDLLIKKYEYLLKER